MALDDYDSINALTLALGARCWKDPEYADSSIGLTSEAYAAIIHPSTMNKTVCQGSTPLHLAARKCSIKALKELIKAGADLSIKCDLGLIPLEQSFQSDAICSNAEAMRQLIPQKVDSFVLLHFLCLLQQGKRMKNLSHMPEILARIVMSTKQDDLFSLHHVLRLNVTTKHRHLTFSLESNIETKDGRGMCRVSHFNSQVLLAISELARKVLCATTKPSCSKAFIQYKARYTLYTAASQEEESNAKFQDVAEKVDEIEATFDGPLSLFELCGVAIRRCIQGPRYEAIGSLPLPKLVYNRLRCLNEANYICDLIKGQRK